jgi:hypothetical protein
MGKFLSVSGGAGTPEYRLKPRVKARQPTSVRIQRLGQTRSMRGWASPTILQGRTYSHTVGIAQVWRRLATGPTGVGPRGGTGHGVPQGMSDGHDTFMPKYPMSWKPRGLVREHDSNVSHRVPKPCTMAGTRAL